MIMRKVSEGYNFVFDDNRVLNLDTYQIFYLKKAFKAVRELEALGDIEYFLVEWDEGRE